MCQESIKFRIVFVISQFYRSVAFRGVPWGSGGRPSGVAINAQHSTRKCEIDESTVDGAEEKQKVDPGIPKIPASIRNFPILPARGVPGGVPRGGH